MKDLTQGSIVRNILAMAAPLAAGMIFQTLYFLVDLYFVAGLGDASVAGVGAAGTLMFGIMALTQVRGVGAVALIAQAVGRRVPADANLVFNQSVSLAVACALATLIGGYALAGAYVTTIAADAATQAQGVSYLYWFLPGLALGFGVLGVLYYAWSFAKYGRFTNMSALLISAAVVVFLIGLVSEQITALTYRRDD